MATLRITGDARADELLGADPFALLLGMLLDQQYPIEQAFRGPATLRDRLGTLDPAVIAAADPDELAATCAAPPAIHRYPGAMAARIQGTARAVVDTCDGHAERLWEEATSGAELVRRLQALPGFGRQKAQIFTALLAKQLGVRPDGWERAAGDYALDGYRSVADVVDPASLQQLRETRRRAKAAARAAGG